MAEVNLPPFDLSEENPTTLKSPPKHQGISQLEMNVPSSSKRVPLALSSLKTINSSKAPNKTAVQGLKFAAHRKTSDPGVLNLQNLRIPQDYDASRLAHRWQIQPLSSAATPQTYHYITPNLFHLGFLKDGNITSILTQHPLNITPLDRTI